jgi:hypothetical protein
VSMHSCHPSVLVCVWFHMLMQHDSCQVHAVLTHNWMARFEKNSAPFTSHNFKDKIPIKKKFSGLVVFNFFHV